MISHATIIPLIGGLTLSQERVFGSPPEYLLTYDGFGDNEKHLLNYYASRGIDVPYFNLSRGERPTRSVDVVSTVCPCAGLSQLSHAFGATNENNQWMETTARYVLGELRPRVFWGENARGFASSMGDFIRDKIYSIGRENGYTMSVYRTASLYHGNPQIRERSFYFFWRDEKTPLLEYFDRPRVSIEETLESVTTNFQHEPINDKIPTRDPYYRFVLEKMFDGIGHAEFVSEHMREMSVRTNDIVCFAQAQGRTLDDFADYFDEIELHREAEKCRRKQAKLNAGGSLMYRGVIIPKGQIGAFVGHYPTMLAHHKLDRYVTYREAMTIMGLPQDFELLDPKKSVNHICQNVPMQTAIDMASQVKKYVEGDLPMIDSTYTFQYNSSKKHEVREERSARTLEYFLS